MDWIDLRSDTVTRPSPEMRAAIAAADVGDDVFGEDPTVNLLQEEVARLFGKPSGLFVTSGVMGNQLAIKAHTEPGDEVIVESQSHVIQYETAAPAIWSGVQLMPVPGANGILDAATVERAFRPGAYYFPRTKLLCLENTHNKAGGTIYPIETIRGLRALTGAKGIRLHIDGARIWNASVATGVAPAEYARHCDSIAVCFSKGLGAPVGSMLLGEKDFIARAHRFRKIFGGGMRQAGILAAAALYAVRANIPRLADDHRNARSLAEALARIPGVGVDPARVQTNIVILDIAGLQRGADRALEELKREGVLLTDAGPDRLRAVTHMDVSAAQIASAAERISRVLSRA